MADEHHTPAPQASRGIYGFVLFVMMNLCTISYFVWMFLPNSILENLPYEPPQQYWGLAIPIFLCTCLFIFAFCIYPAAHSLHDGELDHSSSFTDSHSLPKNYFDDQREKVRKVNHFSISLNHNEQLSLSLRGRGHENKRHTWSNKTLSLSKDYQRSRTVVETCKPVPAVSDMDLDDVCKLLYSNYPKRAN